MTHSRKRALCWLYAALMTAALMTLVLLGPGVSYVTNDDPEIAKAFLGYESGSPAHWHLFIHGILAWPLYWLSCAFPNLPWFSYTQLILLVLAVLVFAKSLMQVFVKHEKPLWMGAVLTAACLLTVIFEYTAKMTFTITAAYLGMAACMQIFSIEHDRGGVRVVLGMAGALALFAYAYALRQDAFWPLLGFCGIAFLIVLAEEYAIPRRPIRSMVLSLTLIVAVAAALLGVRSLELNNESVRAYVEWEDAGTRIIDYYGWQSVSLDDYKKEGLTQETLRLAEAWCFLDPDVSTEAMKTLTAYAESPQQPSLYKILQKAWAHFRMVVRYNPLEMRCLTLFLICAAAVLVGLCLTHRWRYVGYAAVLTAAVGVMLIYLSYWGRLPIRALRTVALPAGAIVLGMLPACMPHGKTRPVDRALGKPAGAALPNRHTLLAGCCMLCAALSLWCFADVLPQATSSNAKKQEHVETFARLEQYALEHPDTLFLYDNAIAEMDMRVLPQYPNGVPSNLASWGGWGMRSPQNVAMFKRFGIELSDFCAEDLLNVCIVTDGAMEGVHLLGAWMEAELGCGVTARQLEQVGEAYVYRFERAAP